MSFLSRILPLSTYRARVLCSLVFVFSMVVLIEAQAACPVLLTPADAEEAWKKAATEAEKGMQVHEDGLQDCRSVSIEVQREGNALMTFTTVDGRIAARLLHAPEDIEPTLEALLVTLPAAPEAVPEAPTPERARVSPAKAEPKPSAPKEGSAAPPIPQIPAAASPHFVLGVSGGGRWGVDEMLFGPSILVRGSYVLSAWELGVRAEYTPTYSRLIDGDPAGFRMYSLAASIAIGRREGIRGIEIPFGVAIGLAGVHEDIDVDPNVKGDINLDTFEPLLGTYLGLLAPRRNSLRFSLGLSLDAALAGLKESAAKLRGLPALPRFGLGLSIGMEVFP